MKKTAKTASELPVRNEDVLKEKIEKTASAILGLEERGELQVEKVSVIIGELSATEIALLYEELSRLETVRIGNMYTSVDNTMHGAQADAEFGQLPPSMGDFYDNEIASDHRGIRQARQLFDRIKACLKRAESRTLV